MAASSTDRLPPAGCTIAIVSTSFAPPPIYLSATRILHLQGGVTLKTLPVLNYPVPLSLPLFPFSALSSSRLLFLCLSAPVRCSSYASASLYSLFCSPGLSSPKLRDLYTHLTSSPSFIQKVSVAFN